jgi:hypothetical protein
LEVIKVTAAVAGLQYCCRDEMAQHEERDTAAPKSAAPAPAAQMCYRCGERKSAALFTRRIDDRHYRMCQACVSEILAARPSGGRERLAHTATHRTCYLCRRVLSVADFTRRSNGSYFSACKACNRHVFAARRRARLEGAGGTHTRAEWDALLARYEQCPLCGRRWEEIPPHPGGGAVITEDHIVPLSRGGGNGIENLQPLCYSCNSRKGARLP